MSIENVFGAITNTGSQEAIRHAELYYKEIRKFTTAESDLYNKNLTKL